MVNRLSSPTGLLNHYTQHLSKVKFLRPSDIVRESIMQDETVVFFGGQDWRNVQADLSPIQEEYKSKFVLSLFMIVLTDQALYTHGREHYDIWRAHTSYPKFGWSGFGPHFENPFKILWAPERDGLIDVEQTITLMENFVSFLIEETNSFFEKKQLTLDTKLYFEKICNDGGYAFNQGEIIPAFKDKLEHA